MVGETSLVCPRQGLTFFFLSSYIFTYTTYKPSGSVAHLCFFLHIIKAFLNLAWCKNQVLLINSARFVLGGVIAINLNKAKFVFILSFAGLQHESFRDLFGSHVQTDMYNNC